MSNQATAPAPTPRRRVRLVAFLVGGLLLATALVAGVAWWWPSAPTSAEDAQPGQCVLQTGDDRVSPIGCKDADAEFTVLGRVPDRTEQQAGDPQVCAAFPDTTSTYWHPHDGQDRGVVLCRASND